MRGTAISTTSDPTSTGTRTTKTKASESRERRAIVHLRFVDIPSRCESESSVFGEILAEKHRARRRYGGTTHAMLAWLRRSAKPLAGGQWPFLATANRIKRPEPRTRRVCRKDRAVPVPPDAPDSASAARAKTALRRSI